MVRFLAGAACASLIGIALPEQAETVPELVTAANQDATADQAVTPFYASHNGAPIWLRADGDGAARDLIGVLQRASLDGMASGPTIATQAQALIARAEAGDIAARDSADRLLSTAWVQYVEALQTPP